MSRRSCMVPHAAVQRLLALILLGLAASTAHAQQQPVATTVQLPTFGVSIDAEGQLTVASVADPTGRLRAERLAAARHKLPGPLAGRSELRKVSLVRLEQEIARRNLAGQPLDDAVRHLAGLQRATHVFCLPEQGEVIIAGPAEGWFVDPAGRTVGISTGAPVLLLEDLVVALRAFPPGSAQRPFLGCTIDPPVEGLARLREFQKTIPQTVGVAQRAEVARYVTRGIQDSLGMAEVRVFGISPATHFAQVLVEADYRMKCIGIGLEPPPVKMTTFFAALDSPKSSSLQRWWFTPRYNGLVVSADRRAVRFDGLGVQLLTEDKVLGPDGKILGTAAPTGASLAYTKSFTDKFESIAAASPVYAQLRNMMDMAIAAAFLRKHDYYGQTGWKATVLRDERQVPTETAPVPKRAACLVNAAWKGSRFLAPAGGGVSIEADQALDPDRWTADHQGQLAAQRERLAPPAEPDRWWWD